PTQTFPSFGGAGEVPANPANLNKIKVQTTAANIPLFWRGRGRFTKIIKITLKSQFRQLAQALITNH
ncbi:MAG: hypothetical protein LBD59_08670, partial [Prevotellaceae bacterium]|nr:hypothetical protein [Prevotellaceae bacterium]